MVCIRLVCRTGVDSVHSVRFRWSPCFRLHRTSNYPADTSARFSDPAIKDEFAKPRDRVFSLGKSAVSDLPQWLVLLHVAFPVSASADYLDSPSNPSSVQVLASVFIGLVFCRISSGFCQVSGQPYGHLSPISVLSLKFCSFLLFVCV